MPVTASSRSEYAVVGSFTSLRGVRAPVGQVETQRPQLVQFLSSPKGILKGGSTVVSKPRPMKPNTPLPDSIQMRTQRPQRMHLFLSLTMY